MFLKPSPVIACTASCVRVALRLIARAEERCHTSSRQLSHEPMAVLLSANHIQAGIDNGLDAGGVAQKRLEDRLARDNAFRGRDRTKSSQERGRCHVVESN
jgi:hypothetical protein